MWKPGPGGALAPYAAQHKAPCASASPVALVMATASRPGPCAACTRDVLPGDQIARAGETRVYHYECSPAEAPQAQPQRRERGCAGRNERRGACHAGRPGTVAG